MIHLARLFEKVLQPILVFEESGLLLHWGRSKLWNFHFALLQRFGSFWIAMCLCSSIILGRCQFGSLRLRRWCAQTLGNFWRPLGQDVVQPSSRAGLGIRSVWLVFWIPWPFKKSRHFETLWSQSWLFGSSRSILLLEWILDLHH